MTPLLDAAPQGTGPIAPFPPAEGRDPGLPHLSALVDGGSLSGGTVRDVATARVDDLSGGAAGALFAGAALVAAAALLLALVVPWFSPLERRIP